MRNTLGDLNNYLFEQIERLNDDELSPNDLESEIKRSAAVCNVAKTIIANAGVCVQATKIQVEYGKQQSLTKLIESND